VFAFYLAKNNEAEIFESNQKDLEMATEKLSGFLEGGDLVSEDVFSLKRQVQDKAQYCEQRFQTLLTHVQEGSDRDLWRYREKGGNPAFMKTAEGEDEGAGAGAGAGTSGGGAAGESGSLKSRRSDSRP
jgi:hypothetical protein